MFSGNFEAFQFEIASSQLNMPQKTLKDSAYKGKLHRCPYCLFSRYRTTDVLRHIATHATGSPYECPLCESVFNVKNDLRNHLLTHQLKEIM